MKRSKLLLILALVVVLALGVLVSCNKECAHETYGAWKLTKAPTLTEDGEAVRICTACNVADVATVAKLSDTTVWTPTSTSATHESAGKTTYTSDYGTVEITVDRLTAHVYDKEVAEPQFLASAADCTNAATYRKSCSCGAVGTATFTSGNPLGHDAKSVPEVPAVHTQSTVSNGVAAHHKCDRCGKLFTDATCTTETNMDELTIVAAHNYGAWTFVSAPTCTEAGSQTRECATCHKVDVATTPALGHDYTKGIIVPVDPKDDNLVWDGSEPDEEGVDVPTSTTHARVCDVCHAIDVDNAVAHTYTGAEEIFTINADNTVSSTVKCTACGHSAAGPTKVTGVISEYTVVAAESKAATYTEAGYTVYANSTGSLKFKVVEPKLIAPYDGLTYTALELSRKPDKIADTMTTYLWNSAKFTLDNAGNAPVTGSPFNGGPIKIVINDAATGAITITSGTTVFQGFVEELTGVMVVSNNGFASVYILSPFEMTKDSAVGAYWSNSMAITYHIDCGTYTGHDVNIVVDEDGVVSFGVKFENANGSSILAEECFSQDVLVVKSSDSKLLVTYVKNSDGVLQMADQYRGEHKALMDIDSETDVEVGTLIIDGIGGFVLDDGEDTLSGTYQAVYNDQNELTHFDAYVIVGGKRVAYYHASINVEDNAIKLVPQTITITLNAGDHGVELTGDAATVEAFVNCVVSITAPTAKDAGFVFTGWYNGDNLVTADTVFAADVTLTAHWSSEVVVTIHDGDNTSSVKMAASDAVVTVLPEYVKNTTADTAGTKYFAGWFLDEACTAGKELTDEMLPGGNVDVYAKWVDITWTIANSTVSNVYPFEYDSARGVWQSTCQGVNNGVSAMRIIANGPITVSFKYAASAEGSNYDLIYVELLADLDSATGTEKGKDGNKVDFDGIVWKEMELKLSAGQILQFRYKKDGSGNNNEDRGFVKELTINGKVMSAFGTMPDKYAGTYALASADSLVLDGCGGFTLGSKTGNYTITAENKLDMFVVAGGAVMEYYTVNLDTANSAYTADKVMVNVSFAFGDVPTTLTPASVNAKIVYTLPEAPEVSGYVFRGWYDNAEFTGNAITSVTPSADTTVYAKYDAAVTITYNYGVAGVEDKVVTGKGVSDKVGTLEPIGEVTNGNLVFAGWFLKDGETWGDEVTADTVLTASITAYAKWVEANVLFGTWKGSYPVYSAFNSSIITLEIDAFGKITTSNSTFSNKIVQVSDSNAITIGTYPVTYDETNGYITIVAGNYTYVFTKVDNKDVSVTFSSSYIVKWDDGTDDNYVSDITVGSGDSAVTKRFVLTSANMLVWNPTVTAVDKEGVAVAEGTSYKVKGTMVTVMYDDATISVVYSGSSFVTADSYRGVYTDAALGKVVIDGAGNIWIGTENTITGTYTEVTSGKVGTTISKVYYEVSLNTTEHTCVVAAPKASVTYVVENGSIEGNTTVEIGINVEFTLPAVTPVAGYQFIGWYLTTDTSFANKLTTYTLTSTDAVSFTAKVEETPKWASYETTDQVATFTDNSATFAGETTATNKTYNIRFVVEADGIYYLFGENQKVGGSQNTYAKWSIIDSSGNAVTGASGQAYGYAKTGPITLTAGTYYFQTSLGGQVTGSTTNNDAYGTFTMHITRALHSTADNALQYTLGTEITATPQMVGSKEIDVVYAVTLEAGKKYELTTKFNEYSQTKIFTNKWLTANITFTTNSGNSSYLNNSSSTPINNGTFTSSTAGTYYIVTSSAVTFTLAEYQSAPTVNDLQAKSFSKTDSSGGWGYTSVTYVVEFSETDNTETTTSGSIKVTYEEDWESSYNAPSPENYAFTATIDAAAKTVTISVSGKDDIVATYTDSTLVFPSTCSISSLSSKTLNLK